AAAIAAVEAMDVPAPRLLGASPDGAETDGAPSLLMSRAAGRVWLTPHDLDSWIRELATLLPTLHAGSADVRTRQPRDLDELAERFRRVYESEAGRQIEPWWDIHQLLAYNDSWRTFIPVQVAGRAPVDVREMTGRVEKLLVMALARV